MSRQHALQISGRSADGSASFVVLALLAPVRARAQGTLSKSFSIVSERDHVLRTWPGKWHMLLATMSHTYVTAVQQCALAGDEMRAAEKDMDLRGFIVAPLTFLQDVLRVRFAWL